MKTLSYAYPNSPMANKLNDGAGCWLVYDGTELPPFVFQEWEEDKARDMLDSINRPLSEWSM